MKSITNSITTGQKKQIVRVCEDAASKAATEAVERALLTRELAQQILGKGDKLQAELTEVVSKFICRVSVDLRAREDLRSHLRDLNIALIIPAKPECTVAHCFTDKKVFAYCDSDFNNRDWLPKTLPASGKVTVSGYELTRTTTEGELSKVGGTFTNPLQIEDLILRTERGEKTGLITNGYANLFLLVVGASVFAVDARRYSDGWHVRCYRFFARYEWHGVYRFFSPAT